MDANKLAKQLKKELTRNIKKTVALGLVTLVALWFWAPLASKWIWGDAKKKKARAAAIAAAQAITETTPDATAPAKSAMPEVAWDLLLDHIAKDELMSTATLPAGARDPFAMTPVEEEVVAVAAPETTAPGVVTAPPKADPTPESLGLKLEATFVSRHASRAVISGKTYRLGERVKVATASEVPAPDASTAGPAPLEFELKAIEKLRVVLMRNEKEFSLTIKRETLGEDEQLLFSAHPQVPGQP